MCRWPAFGASPLGICSVPCGLSEHRRLEPLSSGQRGTRREYLYVGHELVPSVGCDRCRLAWHQTLETILREASGSSHSAVRRAQRSAKGSPGTGAWTQLQPIQSLGRTVVQLLIGNTGFLKSSRLSAPTRSLDCEQVPSSRVWTCQYLMTKGKWYDFLHRREGAPR